MNDSTNKIDILLKDLEITSTSIAQYVEQYHKQVTFVYIYGTIILTLFSLVEPSELLKLTGLLDTLDKDELKIQSENVRIFVSFISPWILIFTSLIGFYLYSTVLNSLYMIYLLGIRRAAIEQLINNKTGESLLVWNSKIIPIFFSVNFILKKSWVNPSYFVSLFIFLFFIATNTFLVILCNKLSPDISIYFTLVSVILMLFSIYQWFALLTTGTDVIIEEVARNSGLPKDFILSNRKIIYNEIQIFKRRKNCILISLSYTCLGILPMLMSTLYNNTFASTSNCDYPLILFISIIIGDTIFLSIFNYYFIRLYFEVKPKKRIEFVGLIFLLCINLLVFYIVHNLWATDNVTSFMDLSFGKLTFAGYWHWVYSSIEATIIFSYLYIWTKYTKSYKNIFEIGLNGWKWLCLYTLCGIADFIIKLLFLSYEKWYENLENEFVTIIKILLAYSILLYSKRYIKMLKFENSNA